MSFILDALKKSESDRQRQSGPSLFEVKVAPPRRTLPIWAVAIAVLLVINVIVISWMLLRHPATQQTQRPPPTQQPAGPAAGPAQAPITNTVPSSIPSPTSSPAAPIRAESSSPSKATAPAASGEDQSAGQATGAAEEDAKDPSDYAPAVEPAGAQGSAAAASASDGLPLYQQIVTSDGLPSLHLDLHVFADHPRDRFVMINMHRLGEGDSLPSGVQVQAIRPDGVVLTYRGTKFLLPRN